jgi:hypothetical protein
VIGTNAVVEGTAARVCRNGPTQGDLVSTPDHVENTGDNLRHAAEVQEQARDDETETPVPPEQSASDNPLPDFNT